MTIYVKVGTGPGDRVKAKRIRKAPNVGQQLEIVRTIFGLWGAGKETMRVRVTGTVDMRTETLYLVEKC